jgi:hypothetical protein
MSSISLLTPTYVRDMELCALLCESVDRYVTSYAKHYLIVADEDFPHFAKFNGSRRVVLRSSQLLPQWLRQLPQIFQRKNRRYWWSLRTKPVNGWHVQQLLKIAAASTLPDARYCILDSDVVFFRPFDFSFLQKPAPVPLFHMPNEIAASAPLHARWVRTSHQMLGLPEPSFPATDFIDHVITWDQAAVRAMTAKIESVTGLDWVEALCRTRHFSEYMLYGYFVQSDVQHMQRHVLTSKKFCLSYWDVENLDEVAIDNMLKFADDGYVAFSAASFSGTPVELIRSSLGKFVEMPKQIA